MQKNAKPRIWTELNLVLDLYESKTHRMMAGTLAEKQYDNTNRVRVLKDTEKLCYSFNKVPTVDRGPIHMREGRLFVGASEKHHTESPSPQPAFPMVCSATSGENALVKSWAEPQLLS